MALAIANRYASALAGVVSQDGAAAGPEEAMEQLELFQRMLGGSPDLENALTSPAVEAAKKRRLIAALSERTGLAVPVRNFLYVVIDHRRLPLLSEMIAAFRSWLDERAGIVRINVTAARELDERLRDSVVEKFRRVTGKQIYATFGVGGDLLGGAIVRHGSTVFDGSLRAQLKALDRSIAGE